MGGFLGAFAAMLLDPIVLIACWVTAAMIGAYRVAIPVCAAVAFAIFAGLSGHPLTWLNALLFALIGAIHGGLGLWLWRLVPSRVKRAFVSNDPS